LREDGKSLSSRIVNHTRNITRDQSKVVCSRLVWLLSWLLIDIHG
jgi:hypothetical protein